MRLARDLSTATTHGEDKRKHTSISDKTPGKEMSGLTAVPNFLKLYPALLGPQDQVDAKIQSVCENHDASFWDVVLPNRNQH